MLDLTRLGIIGIIGAAATLVACIEDTTTESAGAALEAGSASDAGYDAGHDAGYDAGCYVPTRLDVTLDRSTIATELATSSTVVVALTGSGGFGGTATLSASLRDPNGNALPGWTIALSTATVSVPQNGTAIAIATVTIPSENRGLVGTARIVAASNAATGTFTAEATLVALDQITFPIAIANGQCIYPSPAPNTVTVTIGTKLRWLNKPTNTSNLSIHIGSNPYGIAHQAVDPGSAPGQVYEQTVTGSPSTALRWYCHSPGLAADNFIQPVI